MDKYARNRNKAVYKILHQQLKLESVRKDALIIEFGAGKGEFINRIKQSGFTNTAVIESDIEYANQLSSNHKVFNSIDEGEGAEIIFLIDVLEHLEKDESYLRQFYRILKPGGKIFIYVPAMAHLFSPFDKSIGHYRRYKLSALKKKISYAGFTINNARYHDMPGYFAVLISNVILRRKTLSPLMVRTYDFFLVPLSNLIESMIRPPFGKSLWVVGGKS